MSEAAVLTEVVDGVLVVTINRPEAKNAANGEVARGIAAAMDELDGNDALRVGIITGAGGTFCAGMDLSASTVMQAGRDDFRTRMTSEALRVGVHAQHRKGVGMTRLPQHQPVCVAQHGRRARRNRSACRDTGR